VIVEGSMSGVGFIIRFPLRDCLWFVGWSSLDLRSKSRHASALAERT
jgi:hypothetical protein